MHGWIQKVLSVGTNFFFFHLCGFFKLIREERVQISQIPLNKKRASLTGQLWPNIECWPGCFVIFQGIWVSIAKES